MKATFIAIVGGKSSGKTATVEALTRELTKRGYNVAAVKHISERDFTIDQEGKDTWRFAKAGAQTVVSVASNEIATIEKTVTKISLAEILEKCKTNNIVLLEGFRNLVKDNPKIPKIVAVKSAKEFTEFSENFKPILAFTGSYSPENQNSKAPYVDVLKCPEKLADIVEKSLGVN